MYEVDATKLKEARVTANLNQEEVGKRIGKSSKNVSHYETGRAKPTADTLLSFLIELEVSPTAVAKKV